MANDYRAIKQNIMKSDTAKAEPKVPEQPFAQVPETSPAASVRQPAFTARQDLPPFQSIQDLQTGRQAAQSPTQYQGTGSGRADVPVQREEASAAEAPATPVAEQAEPEQKVPEQKVQEQKAPEPKAPDLKNVKNEAKKPLKSVRPKDDNTQKVRIDLPRALARLAREQIPEADNNSDAVAAWIWAKCDRTVEVPQYIKELSSSYAGDKITERLKAMDETVSSLDRHFRASMGITDGRVQELWYMLAFLMLERMGEIPSPVLEKLDLELPVFDTVREKVRQQTAMVRNRQSLRNGRNIRSNADRAADERRQGGFRR